MIYDIYFIPCIAANAASTITDYLVAPSLLNTFEANEALSGVFGVTGRGGGLEDDVKSIKSPEQLRLRRVFTKSAHGTLNEEMEPGKTIANLLFIPLLDPFMINAYSTDIHLSMQ